MYLRTSSFQIVWDKKGGSTPAAGATDELCFRTLRVSYEVQLLSSIYHIGNKTVSYKEYFRQIFGGLGVLPVFWSSKERLTRNISQACSVGYWYFCRVLGELPNAL